MYNLVEIKGLAVCITPKSLFNNIISKLQFIVVLKNLPLAMLGYDTSNYNYSLFTYMYQ